MSGTHTSKSLILLMRLMRRDLHLRKDVETPEVIVKFEEMKAKNEGPHQKRKMPRESRISTKKQRREKYEVALIRPNP